MKNIYCWAHSTLQQLHYILHRHIKKPDGRLTPAPRASVMWWDTNAPCEFLFSQILTLQRETVKQQQNLDLKETLEVLLNSDINFR